MAYPCSGIRKNSPPSNASVIEPRRPPWPVPRAAYVHVPFCAHHCGYCNFTVLAGHDDLTESFFAALTRELNSLQTPREVDTLYIGGGTPTHLKGEQLERLLNLARHWFPLATGYEFTVEANPIDLHAPQVRVLASGGVNRVSLGAQSFNAEKLKLLERDHTARHIELGVQLLRDQIRGCDVSLDLIFAAPGESPEIWQSDLERAIAIAPDHLSTYGLTFERGTTFYSRRERGELNQLDEDLERSLYEFAIDRLAHADYEHYEVSNFARPGHRSRHNQVYWAGDGYFAAGPGASRYVDGRRETNHRSTTTYIKRMLAGQSPVAESECLNAEDRAREALVIGLRRMAGIEIAEFERRWGFEVRELVGPALERFLETGLLEESAGHLRLTREGLFVSDGIWTEFLRQ